MSAPDERIPTDLAQATAEKLVDLLAPFCTRLEIAGSLRRGQRPDVGDIELICEPAFANRLALFEEIPAVQDLLEDRLDALLMGATIQHAPAYANRRAPWGPRYKRLVFDTLPVDLFIVRPPASWGAELIIRTGPWQFSKALVTPRAQGGLMPAYLKMREGALHRGAERIPTPTEADLFRLYSLDYLEPADRRWPLPPGTLRPLQAPPA